MVSIIKSTDIFFCAVLWIISVVSSAYFARYSAKRFNADKKKTVVCFATITAAISLFMLCFFGSSVITVKGIVLLLVFVIASFEDIKTRECDDFLHVMIVIAAFIGTNKETLLNMFISAGFVFVVMIATLCIIKNGIGGADIKFSTACAFLLGVEKGVFGFVMGLLLAIIFNLIKNRKNKKSGFPMIPYLAVGFMTAFLI